MLRLEIALNTCSCFIFEHYTFKLKFSMKSLLLYDSSNCTIHMLCHKPYFSFVHNVDFFVNYVVVSIYFYDI